MNINSDLAKLATTASVLVNSATGNSSINDMLQKNRAFASTFDSNTKSNGASDNRNGNGVSQLRDNGLIGLLAKHEDNLRIAKSLKRSNFTGNGKKKKDFNVLSNDMLNDIPDSDVDSLGNRTGSADNDIVSASTNADSDAHNDNVTIRVSKRSTYSHSRSESAPFSLFQGFSAVLPEVDETITNIKMMSGKMIKDGNDKGKRKVKDRKGKSTPTPTPTAAYKLKKIEDISSDKIKSCQNRRVLNNYKSDINYHLDLIEIRKGLGNSEINEIDSKIDRLFLRRKEIADNIQIYEETEGRLEEQLLEIKDRLEFIKDISVLDNDESDDNVEVGNNSNRNTNSSHGGHDNNDLNEKHKKIRQQKKKGASQSVAGRGEANTGTEDLNGYDENYEEDYVNVDLDESDEYTRITSSTKRPVKPGDLIHEFQAHNDSINCIAIDEPYGRMLTCSMDNTVRLWDMNRYKCIGLLEGHYASVECVSIEDSFAFTGSNDATVKMWNLDYFNKAYQQNNINEEDDDDDYCEQGNVDAHPLINSFEGHMDTVTALSYNNGELISGSNDKTIRQWDLNTGHLLQTIDIMWASSMANSMINFGNEPGSRKVSGTGRISSNTGMANTVSGTGENYPFISSLQVFDAALASATSDGIVRLWDLRSGEVIRQLFGHTGPVTTLQFDKSFTLMTGSADRSVRIWDLRNGGLLDSFSYDMGIRKVQFDETKVVSLCETESKVHVYDRTEQRHWSIGDTGADTEEELNVADIVTDTVFAGNYLVSARAGGRVGVFGV